MRRAIRRDRRGSPDEFDAGAERSALGEARPRSSRKRTVRTGVAFVREISDVPQRVLAPGVRSATAMYKRMVDDALRIGAIDAELLPSYTDEGLLHRLEHAHPTPLLDALRTRKLYKRALEWPASQLDDGFGEWIATDRERTRSAEDEIARELGMQPAEVLLDFPMKTQMLGLDIPVQRRSGEVERLTGEGWPGTINLPSLSEELYRSARWLRVFVARRMEVPGRVRAILDAMTA